MFKYLVLSVAMFSCVTFAEPIEPTVPTGPTEYSKTVMCDSTKIMIPFLESEFDEHAMFIGEVPLEESKTAYVGVTVNPATQTWTVILFNQQTSCILESGSGFKFKMPVPSAKDLM
jgi:hypothetical protein